MTGNRDNISCSSKSIITHILGISFGNKHSIENNIEVIKLNFPNIDNNNIRTSKTEVLNQVLSGLNFRN